MKIIYLLKIIFLLHLYSCGKQSLHSSQVSSRKPASFNIQENIDKIKRSSSTKNAINKNFNFHTVQNLQKKIQKEIRVGLDKNFFKNHIQYTKILRKNILNILYITKYLSYYSSPVDTKFNHDNSQKLIAHYKRLKKEYSNRHQWINILALKTKLKTIKTNIQYLRDFFTHSHWAIQGHIITGPTLMALVSKTGKTTKNLPAKVDHFSTKDLHFMSTCSNFSSPSEVIHKRRNTNPLSPHTVTNLKNKKFSGLITHQMIGLNRVSVYRKNNDIIFWAYEESWSIGNKIYIYDCHNNFLGLFIKKSFRHNKNVYEFYNNNDEIMATTDNESSASELINFNSMENKTLVTLSRHKNNKQLDWKVNFVDPNINPKPFILFPVFAEYLEQIKK